jgi:hypothetical protein
MAELLTPEAQQREWVLLQLLGVLCTKRVSGSHAADNTELVGIDERPASTESDGLLAIEEPHPRDDLDVAAIVHTWSVSPS